MIRYVMGDATRPPGSEPRIIVHVCNDVGGWGKGFVTALSKRWTEPERRYRAWYRGDEPDLPFELGQIQVVEVEDALWVVNMLGQKGLRWSGGRPPIRYDAVRVGLSRVRELARKRGAAVHMPRIGCGLAGGTWDDMGPIIEEELTNQGVQVTVYDFE
jgi:O-acetyl-ADP-ribose deacetylase (regulator of RNase III)